MVDKHHIENMRDDELSPKERQEVRYVNGRVLNDFVDPKEIIKRNEQHDILWAYIGWLPSILQNWKALGVAAGVAFFIGGGELVSNLVLLIERMGQ